jgi:hypothetical protein
MKAILASGNFIKVDGAVELTEKIVGKPRDKINIAVINEAAAVEFGDARWAIDILHDVANTFGGVVEIIHFNIQRTNYGTHKCGGYITGSGWKYRLVENYF